MTVPELVSDTVTVPGVPPKPGTVPAVNIFANSSAVICAPLAISFPTLWKKLKNPIISNINKLN